MSLYPDRARWRPLHTASSRREPRAHVAVVGAGISGLATAALLARRGVPVTVFEAQSRIGGVAGVLTLDGQRFCPGPQYLWGFGEGGEGRRILERMGLALDVREMVSTFDQLALVQGRYMPVIRGVPTALTEWTRRMPRQETPIARFTGVLDGIGEACVRISRGARFMDRGARMIGRVATDGSLPWRARWAVGRHRGQSVAGCAARLGVHPAALRLIAYHQAIFAERLDDLSLVLFAAARHHLKRPLVVPRGGTLRLVETLASGIERGGGDIAVGTRVEAVRRTRDALWVDSSGPDGMRTTQASQVVFACAPPVVERLMPEARPRHAPGHPVTALCLALEVDEAARRRLAGHNFTWYRSPEGDVAFDGAPDRVETLNFTSPTLNGGAEHGDRCVVTAFYPGGDEGDRLASEAESIVLAHLRRSGSVRVRDRRLIDRRGWQADFGSFAGAVYGRRLTARSIRRPAFDRLPRDVFVAHSGAGISGVMGCLEMAERAADAIADRVGSVALRGVS